MLLVKQIVQFGDGLSWEELRALSLKKTWQGCYGKSGYVGRGCSLFTDAYSVGSNQPRWRA